MLHTFIKARKGPSQDPRAAHFCFSCLGSVRLSYSVKNSLSSYQIVSIFLRGKAGKGTESSSRAGVSSNLPVPSLGTVWAKRQD